VATAGRIRHCVQSSSGCVVTVLMVVKRGQKVGRFGGLWLKDLAHTHALSLTMGWRELPELGHPMERAEHWRGVALAKLAQQRGASSESGAPAVAQRSANPAVEARSPCHAYVQFNPVFSIPPPPPPRKKLTRSREKQLSPVISAAALLDPQRPQIVRNR